MCHVSRPSRLGTYPIKPQRTSVFSQYARSSPIKNQMQVLRTSSCTACSAHYCLVPVGRRGSPLAGSSTLLHAPALLLSVPHRTAAQGVAAPACRRGRGEGGPRRALRRVSSPTLHHRSDLRICCDDPRRRQTLTGAGGGMWSTVGRGGVR